MLLELANLLQETDEKKYGGIIIDILTIICEYSA